MPFLRDTEVGQLGTIFLWATAVEEDGGNVEPGSLETAFFLCLLLLPSLPFSSLSSLSGDALGVGEVVAPF